MPDTFSYKEEKFTKLQEQLKLLQNFNTTYNNNDAEAQQCLGEISDTDIDMPYNIPT